MEAIDWCSMGLGIVVVVVDAEKKGERVVYKTDLALHFELSAYVTKVNSKTTTNTRGEL